MVRATRRASKRSERDETSVEKPRVKKRRDSIETGSPCSSSQQDHPEVAPVSSSKTTDEPETSDRDVQEGKGEDPSLSDDQPLCTESLRIDNFRRPFTLNAVKALVQECGPFVDSGFWMNSIKTHCYVTYPSKAIAEQTRQALDGRVWPVETGQALSVQFSEHSAMDVNAGGVPQKRSVPSDTRLTTPEKSAKPSRKVTSIDSFFLRTETKPMLYYLPLTDEEVRLKREKRIQTQSSK
ncbi:hypothetical protein Poli38472_002416 [Pythium oligandrum]|uniref:Apoptotic chromatin condensation inducer in the nucleus n=1 Tax=Pythium oligandrum TaxID=41045 RepID=A0A8K1CHT1_PYTOL|nr:hypothetical protein Poli38472_002416 [Pythium oligandrum]|eukprot:TMW63475.1 hypothetical protein Poli38472_002416 [Pythium oligandrum]